MPLPLRASNEDPVRIRAWAPPAASQLVERLHARVAERSRVAPVVYPALCGALVAISLAFAYIGGANEFIYFQF